MSRRHRSNADNVAADADGSTQCNTATACGHLGLPVAHSKCIEIYLQGNTRASPKRGASPGPHHKL